MTEEFDHAYRYHELSEKAFGLGLLLRLDKEKQKFVICSQELSDVREKFNSLADVEKSLRSSQVDLDIATKALIAENLWDLY